MTYLSNLRSFLLSALALSAVTAHADLKIVSKVTVTSLKGPQVVTVVSFFKGSMVRIDNGDVTKISDSRTHKTILINRTKGLYIIPDNAQAMQSAENSLKNQHMKIVAHIKPTGKSKKIAGHLAKQYVGDLTVSGDYPMVPGARASATFHLDEWTTIERGITVSQSEMMGTVSDLLHSLGGVGGMQKVTSELSKIKGIPLNTVLDGSVTIYAASGGAPQTQKHSYETEAQYVNEGTLPASVFQIPKGFKQVGNTGTVPKKSTGAKKKH